MAKIGKPRSSKGLAVLCARLADEKIANDIIILDLSKIDIASTDYFVICSCDSDAQIKSLVSLIEKTCKEMKLGRPRTEGAENAQWVLLDFFDVIVHIMLPEIREYYKIEKLWADAKFFRLNEEGKAIAAKV